MKSSSKKIIYVLISSFLLSLAISVYSIQFNKDFKLYSFNSSLIINDINYSYFNRYLFDDENKKNFHEKNYIHEIVNTDISNNARYSPELKSFLKLVKDEKFTLKGQSTYIFSSKFTKEEILKKLNEYFLVKINDYLDRLKWNLNNEKNSIAQKKIFFDIYAENLSLDTSDVDYLFGLDYKTQIIELILNDIQIEDNINNFNLEDILDTNLKEIHNFNYIINFFIIFFIFISSLTLVFYKKIFNDK